MQTNLRVNAIMLQICLKVIAKASKLVIAKAIVRNVPLAGLYV